MGGTQAQWPSNPAKTGSSKFREAVIEKGTPTSTVAPTLALQLVFVLYTEIAHKLASERAEEATLVLRAVTNLPENPGSAHNRLKF